MNEAPHVTDRLLDRLARRDLRAEEMLLLEEHLDACGACARRARARANDARARLREFFMSDEPVPLEHPGRAVLELYALGRLDEAATELVAGHLDECTACASAVDAIRAQRGSMLRMLWLSAAAAAMLAIVVAVLLTHPRTTTSAPPAPTRRARVTPPSPLPVQVAATRGNRQWDALVNEAVAKRRLHVPPDLAALRGAEDVVRGSVTAKDRVSPAGRTIDSARPAFTWPARKDATYTLFVFDGEQEIARSNALHVTHWTPAHDLPRGRTLTWQVEAARGEVIDTIPSPPAPAARFRITSEADHRELSRALDTRHDDFLLLSVLYARAGMVEEARAVLSRVPDDPLARVLMESLPKE